jgi:hypothetical protein
MGERLSEIFQVNRQQKGEIVVDVRPSRETFYLPVCVNGVHTPFGEYLKKHLLPCLVHCFAPMKKPAVWREKPPDSLEPEAAPVLQIHPLRMEIRH